MTSTVSTAAASAQQTGHGRPIGAKLRSVATLRVRLALLVALSIAMVIGVVAYLEARVFERAVERDLVDTARRTALAVADDFELRGTPIDRGEISADLHELAVTVPSLRTVTIVAVLPDRLDIIASTSSGERQGAIDLAAQAVREGRPLFVDAGLTTVAAVPITRADGMRAAAVATVSLASVTQLRTKGRQVVLWFTPAAIILLTLLVDFLGRRYIHRPIDKLRGTMMRAGAGDFSARAEIVRPDEIGSVALGLNDMLQRLQHFNEALHERVEGATAQLRERNAELVDSYERVLALREALARAEQMAAVGQMAASVAHQVGTPLNLISGYVQMMQEDTAGDPKAGRRLEIVQEQIGKVAAVVRTLLDQSRRPRERHPAEIGALLARVADVARPKLGAAGITLTLDLAPDLPVILADAEELELSMLNLVTNSLDAMPRGGTLAISAGRHDHGVRIQVADTGTGIPQDLLPRIFDPWVTTKPAGRGTGLGLSITRDAIARHGGTIHAESVPGARTTFTIDLPLTAAEPPDGENPHR